jgi:hypothetical protein
MIFLGSALSQTDELFFVSGGRKPQIGLHGGRKIRIMDGTKLPMFWFGGDRGVFELQQPAGRLVGKSMGHRTIRQPGKLRRGMGR